ncbi:hypothetical protein PTSG_10979 [Salpingoeca rosetta]|uniref:Uncharacterized protein n=1 Tax=Salpingoeca rosetta (strain ATCC 50818 / BSB-021) TaxID=946362 RepID=F2USC7_SALR5|nr:uncharacterized protein PTSG_10979 [Salpingoeca rosetta]EGD81036.1 hypothetical protein PTSG_10979 [Salpingoeca rosetta]|eukprot:XP_004987906.1 hypothetical protein PTSG_10979 [Salpingoeca rosetta]
MSSKSPRQSRRSVSLRESIAVIEAPPLPTTESFVFPDGSKYIGGFQISERKFVVREGKGLMKFANGSIYDGEWSNDKMHGHGKLTLSDGTQYEGSFENGEYSGNGTLTLANGTTCSSTFANNTPVGNTTLVDAAGKKWVAVWGEGTGAFKPCL